MLHPESGSKILLESETDGRILVCLRDNIPEIPYPNMWDLPGGGVEPGEDLRDCANRELFEEFGLRVPLLLVGVERHSYNPDIQMGRFRGVLTPQDIGRIVFGPEGQAWDLMTVEQIATVPFVPQLRNFCTSQALALAG